MGGVLHHLVATHVGHMGGHEEVSPQGLERTGRKFSAQALTCGSSLMLEQGRHPDLFRIEAAYNLPTNLSSDESRATEDHECAMHLSALQFGSAA